MRKRQAWAEVRFRLAEAIYTPSPRLDTPYVSADRIGIRRIPGHYFEDRRKLLLPPLHLWREQENGSRFDVRARLDNGALGQFSLAAAEVQSVIVAIPQSIRASFKSLY